MSYSFKYDVHRPVSTSNNYDNIKDGRLPGIGGLVQNLLETWESAFNRNNRSPLSMLRSSVQTYAIIKQYRTQNIDQTSKVVSTLQYLRKSGLEKAFVGTQAGAETFALAVLKKNCLKLQERLAKIDGIQISDILREYEFSPGKKAIVYFPESQRDNPDAWEGPFVRKRDIGCFRKYIADIVWGNDITELALSVEIHTSMYGHEEERLNISPMLSDFDFASGQDDWNTVDGLSARFRAFLDKNLSRSVLLYGAPGSGKTTFARALSRKLGMRALIIEGKALNRISSSGAMAIMKLLLPEFLILNDVDRLGSRSSTLLETMETLSASSGHTAKVVVLTVNDLTQLDPALMRPGRISEVRNAKMPEQNTRKIILEYYLKKYNIQLEQNQDILDEMVEFSPADIREFCETAHAVGIGAARLEIARIKEQRELYSGDACANYNKRFQERY